jgi:hypothetical protein
VVIASCDAATPDLYVRALRDRQINLLSVGSCDDSGASEFAWIWLVWSRLPVPQEIIPSMPDAICLWDLLTSPQN